MTRTEPCRPVDNTSHLRETACRSRHLLARLANKSPYLIGAMRETQPARLADLELHMSNLMRPVMIETKAMPMPIHHSFIMVATSERDPL